MLKQVAFLSLLGVVLAGHNDWSKPCTAGECYYGWSARDTAFYWL